MAHYVEYSSNNSGGVDWVTPEMWDKLIEAGWIVDTKFGGRIYSVNRHGLSLRDAIVEWQTLTGLDPAAVGCNCCGVPHRFMELNDEGRPVAEMQIVIGPATWEIGQITW